MKPFTGVCVTQEAGGAPGTKSARRSYYVHVEAESGLAAKDKIEARYRKYWVGNANAVVTKDAWKGEADAPRPDITDIIEGHIKPSEHTLEGNLHPVVIPMSWRVPLNIGRDPDALG